MSKKEIGNSVCLLNFLQYISKILVGLFGFQSSQESILSYFLVDRIRVIMVFCLIGNELIIISALVYKT